ncbi:LysR family transcriptional regulator [Bosea sp. (in: a-proteobacteria)]|uniref:LysR family transcriptional regulator n=1 Tax=Bosea sp. (in: a-proteobacteria) TaxID=1871050 RepID=UPI00121E1AEE|nr:LysR family transcriptional regulator [Bosea sp. (in: a-proteobacteria)]TAJ30383.1 MAG: LysR family transcriptional regulator [Bosea sp. (in: a-proteobacteria)]
MNLRSFDLNLLVVLDALLDEAHVSRAGERIGLSQPAMSSALERCRHLFADRLLERGAGGMVLTPKAQALAAPIKEVLAGMAALLDRREPDLATIRQTVRVVMADLPAVAIGPALQRRLAQTAPGITVVVMPWHGAAAALDGLGRGSIDLAVSVFPKVDADFTRRELLQEHYRVAMRRGHPAAGAFDLDRWLAYPHLLVSGRGDARSPLDEALACIGRARHVGMVVPSFIMVPPLLAESDMIGLLPSRCLPERVRGEIVAYEPPITVEGFPLHSAWHKRRAADPAVQHVARLIEALVAALPG